MQGVPTTCHQHLLCQDSARLKDHAVQEDKVATNNQYVPELLAC